LLALDPLREGSHRLLMRLLARNGQLNAAMQQYEQCRAVLDEELGIAPSPPTRQLHQRLLSAKLPAPFIVPLPQTPFVGREEALALIETRLDDDQCRLLTILGTGGVGKSRLVLQIARQRRRDYLHGIYFVSLVGVETADTIATTLATTLNCRLQDNEPLLNQVISFLQEKELLLILDNFEHLLPDGAQVLQTLLEAIPDVKWLVTSRERLHLPAEWIVPVTGLSTENEAMPLFVQRAQQANAHFVVDDETTMAVQQICQSVEGLPLGIELAATWVRTLSCKEIAAEVNRSLAILADQAPARPERHHSLYAVFAYSWKL
jgi:predicted ATPase